jgi:7,8-dihydropterin-6-yl-methyl-4-(beta-D-ribofuranosyl)aminobenzene 5'-phosphate synthase
MVKITCLTENTALRGSPFWAEHGLSFLIETDRGGVLFDTGQTAAILLHNLALLGKSLKEVDAIVLSHAHNDHTGGLQGLLGVNDHLVVYLPRSFPEAFKAGVRDRARVVEVDGPLQIIDRAWSLGEMGTSPIEQSLILQTRQGAILVTGCAHPGIVSIAQAARDMGPIHLVLGGFHLRDMGEAQIRSILTQLQALDIDLMAPCHCTGDLARQLFAQAYGAAYLPAGVGSVFTFPP